MNRYFSREDTQVASKHEKMLNILSHKGNASKSHSATPTRMTVMEKVGGKKSWWGCRAIGASRVAGGDRKWRSWVLEDNLAVSQTVKHEVTVWPVVVVLVELLGVQEKWTHVSSKTCTQNGLCTQSRNAFLYQPRSRSCPHVHYCWVVKPSVMCLCAGISFGDRKGWIGGACHSIDDEPWKYMRTGGSQTEDQHCDSIYTKSSE